MLRDFLIYVIAPPAIGALGFLAGLGIASLINGAHASDATTPVARVGYSDVYRVETSEVVCYVVEGPRGGGIDCVARVR